MAAAGVPELDVPGRREGHPPRVADPGRPVKRLSTREQVERAAWEATHPDFRGKFEDGTLTILRCGPTGGAQLVSISSLTDAELRAKAKRR